MIVPFPWEGPVLTANSKPTMNGLNYGIFSYKRRIQLALANYIGASKSLYVDGTVALSGHIVEHQYGYRATKALVKEIEIYVCDEGYPLITTFVQVPDTLADKQARALGMSTSAQIATMKPVQWSFNTTFAPEALEKHLITLYQADVTILPLPKEQKSELSLFNKDVLKGLTRQVQDKNGFPIQLPALSIQEMSKIIDEKLLRRIREDQLIPPRWQKIWRQSYYGHRKAD
jgi:hypothetical protein